MGQLVSPKVFFVGESAIIPQGMLAYLRATGNQEFADQINTAKEAGIPEGIILCSFAAKVCYASLTLGKNDNISRIRDIQDNVKGFFKQGHGSVFEHCTLNFIATNCSRVFTHELVRHRAGTAFSQTSGRYVRGDSVNIVFDPILEPVREEAKEIQFLIEQKYNAMVEKLGLNQMKDFNLKKQLTSALRRFLPNGQSNEIAFSLNLRALRHIVQIRTSRFAEWEIRYVFHQVYQQVKERYPLLFCDAKEKWVKGLLEITGMKQQPYEYVPDYVLDQE